MSLGVQAKPKKYFSPNERQIEIGDMVPMRQARKSGKSRRIGNIGAKLRKN